MALAAARRSRAEDLPAERRNFVACPIVRDTASVPCWLAEYDGELYFLTLQTDVSAPVTPPWLGHRVLVEGTAARDRPRICGGVVLEPVVLSVLPELDAACNTAVLPAEDRYNLTFEPPRPPGPSAGRLAFAGAAATAAAGRAAARRSRCATISTGSSCFAMPASSRRSSTRRGRATRAASRSRATAAACCCRTARRSSEQPAIAGRRAEQVAELLRGAGLTDVEYRVRWDDEAGRRRRRTTPRCAASRSSSRHSGRRSSRPDFEQLVRGERAR